LPCGGVEATVLVGSLCRADIAGLSLPKKELEQLRGVRSGDVLRERPPAVLAERERGDAERERTFVEEGALV